MEVTAKARYIRMSPRKVRLVAGLIRGLGVAQAESQLSFSPKAAARPVLKLLRSAIANAEHNHDLDRDALVVKVITVDGGPVLKRWRARAFGRAAPIRKRTSHITVILAEKDSKDGEKAGLKAAVVAKDDKKDKTTKEKAKENGKTAVKKVDTKEIKKTTSKEREVSKKTERKAVEKKSEENKPEPKPTKKPVSQTTKRESKK